MAIPPKRIQGYLDQTKPKTKAHMISFLCSLSFYRRFIPEFAKVTYLLHKVAMDPTTKPSSAFQWTPLLKEQYQSILQLVEKHATIQVPDPTKPFVAIADASKFACSFILFQKDHTGELKIVSCISRMFSAADRNRHIYLKEILAITNGLDTYAHLLQFCPSIRIYTDARGITMLKWAKGHNEFLWRKANYLSQFPITITHINGEANVMADHLSRFHHMAQEPELPLQKMLDPEDAATLLEAIDFTGKQFSAAQVEKFLTSCPSLPAPTSKQTTAKRTKYQPERQFQIEDCNPKTKAERKIKLPKISKYSKILPMQKKHLEEDGFFSDQRRRKQLLIKTQSDYKQQKEELISSLIHPEFVNEDDKLYIQNLKRPTGPRNKSVKKTAEERKQKVEIPMQFNVHTDPFPITMIRTTSTDSSSSSYLDTTMTATLEPKGNNIFTQRYLEALKKDPFPGPSNTKKKVNIDPWPNCKEYSKYSLPHTVGPAILTHNTTDEPYKGILKSYQPVLTLRPSKERGSPQPTISAPATDPPPPCCLANSKNLDCNHSLTPTTVTTLQQIKQGRFNTTQFIRIQQSDPYIQTALACLRSGKLLRGFSEVGKMLVFRASTNRILRPVLPEALAKHLIRLYHYSTVGIHASKSKILATIHAKYFHPKMAKLIDEMIQGCIICTQTIRPKHDERNSSEGTFAPPLRPRRAYAMDLISGLPMTKMGNSNILVIVDLSSLMTRLYALPNRGVEGIIKCLRLLMMHDATTIHSLRTDREKSFAVAQDFKEFCTVHDIQLELTATRSPSSNSNSELMVKMTKEKLKQLSIMFPTEWDQHLHFIPIAYAKLTANHKFTPEQAHFGYESPSVTDILPQKTGTVADLQDTVKDIHTKILATKQKLLLARKKQLAHKKDYANRYLPGSMVYAVQNPIAQNSAVMLPWTGPFKIISNENNATTCTVQDLTTNEVRKYQTDHLKIVKPHHEDVFSPLNRTAQESFRPP